MSTPQAEVLPGGDTSAISAKDWKFVNQVVKDVHDGKKVDVKDMIEAQNIATKGGYTKTAAALGIAISGKLIPPKPASPTSSTPPPTAIVEHGLAPNTHQHHGRKTAGHRILPPAVALTSAPPLPYEYPKEGVLPRVILVGLMGMLTCAGIVYERNRTV